MMTMMSTTWRAMTLMMAMIVAITVIGEVDVVDYNNDDNVDFDDVLVRLVAYPYVQASHVRLRCVNITPRRPYYGWAQGVCYSE